jgi:hypothetical protein
VRQHGRDPVMCGPGEEIAADQERRVISSDGTLVNIITRYPLSLSLSLSLLHML